MRRAVVLGPRQHTNSLTWCAAIICAIVAVAVIISGMVAFIGYLVIKPRVPQISVTTAQLQNFYFDQSNSLLTINVNIVIRAENENAKAHASFYKTSFLLSFGGLQNIANFVADPFSLPPQSSSEFNYVYRSPPIPMDPENNAQDLKFWLRQGIINLELKGKTRTRWRIWVIGSSKLWLHLDCKLRLPLDRSRIYPRRCTSKNYNS